MLYKHFLGEVEFKMQANNSLKVLNELRNCSFNIQNLYIKKECIYGKIYYKKLKILEDVAVKNYAELEILKKNGMYFKISPYQKRIGIIFGIIFAFILVFYLSNITLKIRVIGGSSELKSKVLSVLEVNGLKAGSYIPSCDFNDLQAEIMLTLNDVSWAFIRNSGSVVTVNIGEVVKKPEMNYYRIPTDIVATRDAQVKNVKVLQGKLEVLIGEGVKAGDVLVSGIIPTARGESFFYHSKAEIIGSYSEKVSFEQLFIEEIKEVSEEFEKRTFVEFFSLSLPTGKAIFSKMPTENEYYLKENHKKYSFLSFELPFSIKENKYYKINSVEKKYSEEEVLSLLNDKVARYEANILKDEQIINKTVEVVNYKNKIIYDVEFFLEGEIGQEKNIFIKK